LSRKKFKISNFFFQSYNLKRVNKEFTKKNKKKAVSSEKIAELDPQITQIIADLRY